MSNQTPLTTISTTFDMTSRQRSLPSSSVKPLAGSLPRSPARTLVRPLPRSLVMAFPRSLAETPARSLPSSLTRTLARPPPRPLADSLAMPLPRSLPRTLATSLPGSDANPASVSSSVCNSRPDSGRAQAIPTVNADRAVPGLDEEQDNESWRPHVTEALAQPY
jgi:hypothetical protein